MFTSDNQPNHDRALARKRGASITSSLRVMVKSTDIKLGINDHGTVADKLARVLLRKAIKGDRHAMTTVIERTDGKVPDKQAFTDAEGNDKPLDPRAFATWLSSKLKKPAE